VTDAPPPQLTKAEWRLAAGIVAGAPAAAADALAAGAFDVAADIASIAAAASRGDLEPFYEMELELVLAKALDEVYPAH
jgi:hypothetical protein